MFDITLWGMKINWLAQVFGFISLVIMIVGYQKPRKQFLWHAVISNLFVIAECALLGGWTGVIRFVISVTRNFIIIQYLNRNKEMPFYWIPFFIIVTVVASMFFVNVWYDLLPPIFSIMFTISTCSKNYKLAKCGMITAESGTVVYCLLLGAYVGALRNFLLTVAAVLSLIALLKKEKLARTKAATIATSNFSGADGK